MIKSIYDGNEWVTKGSKTVTLNESERTMICNALAKCSPDEVDIIPIINLCDKIIREEGDEDNAGTEK